MLKHNMQQIYVDEEWAVQQHMALEKSRGWDVMDDHVEPIKIEPI
jgi:hypothetical protein